jgi:excisionase family DNA binding protein
VQQPRVQVCGTDDRNRQREEPATDLAAARRALAGLYLRVGGRSNGAVEAASGGPARRARGGDPELDRLLTKAEAAEALAVSVRFINRCVFERRIRYVKVGKFVRIPTSAVADFISAGEVPARW